MVLIRAYRDEDFVDLARMFDETWGWELKGCAEENFALASLYIALALIASDCVYVAEVDGNVQGVACVQIPNKSGSTGVDLRKYDAAAYMLTVQMLEEKLRQTETGRFALEFYDKIDGVNAVLLEKLAENSIEWDAELKLLLTSPHCRGKGVGKALVAEVFAGLHQQRIKTCMLRTDTHCAWQYYEKTNWKRGAEYDWPDEKDLTALAYVKAVD